jgi:hypothetical protein
MVPTDSRAAERIPDMDRIKPPLMAPAVSGSKKHTK